MLLSFYFPSLGVISNPVPAPTSILDVSVLGYLHWGLGLSSAQLISSC